MLHDYLHEHTSPGTRSAGYTSGREGQRTGHRSAYDRNGLMYAMLLIKLSMGGGEPHGLASTPYDTIAMHDRICGGGSDNQLYKTGAGPAGWRAATFDAASPTYDVAVTANAFAPVVAMGPLEVLQSMRAATIAECPEGFNTADLSHYLACELNDEAVRQDLVTRAERVPFAMQRDLWCDASAQLSIESSVGNPFYFTENLYDTSVKQRFENGRGYRDMVVPAVKRGEEQMDADFRRKTLMGWVYVTSSSSDLRAGMHRLLDLPVFRSTPCRDLPGVTCTAGRGIYTTYTDAEVVSNVVDSTVDFFEDAASTIWNTFSGTGRRLGTYHHVQLNEELPLIDAASTAPAHATFLTGREALPLHRCSYMVERVTGISCHHAVYAASSARGCTAGSLGLVSQPTAYGAEHWVRARLMTVASPSPPPPPPSPHLPPPPPSPHPPPNPPMRVGQLQVMSQVRDIEERMCTSVYYMSQAARCERLALDLTARVHYDKLSPPGSPPAGPYMPPPPPPPPLPSLPEGLLGTLPRTALLSTNRVPAQGLDAGDGFHTSNLATLLAAIVGVAANERACVAGAPLYCATGSLPERCLNAGRNCGGPDANGRDPWVEFTWPHMPDRYLWAIRLTLPPNEQLSRLIVGPKELRLYGPRGELVPCAEGDEEVLDATTGELLTIVCQPGGWEPKELWALGGVHRARLTLKGDFRQLWLAGIEVVERSYAGAGIGRRPPPPPAPPAGPPVA